MKKEIVITIIVIILVIIGNIITQGYTKKCVADMNKNLVMLKEEVSKGEKDEKIIKKKIEEIENKWDKMQENLAFYIEHDELEKVEAQIFLIKGNIEGKLYEDSLPELEKCIFILAHIEDKTSLVIKNIF